jgi:ABC-2 type transport system permease protein
MILAVAWNRFLNLKHDRAAFVLAFVLPVVFFSVFASIFGGARSATRRVPLIVVDEDESAGSRRFVSALQAEKGLALRTSRVRTAGEPSLPFSRASAEAAVREGDVSVALVIPKGFGEHPVQTVPVSSGGPRLVLLSDSADPIAPQLVLGILQKAGSAAFPEELARSGVEAMEQWGASLTAEQKAAIAEHARRSPPASATAPGASLLDIEVTDLLGRSKKNPISAVLAAGLGVMFLLFSAAGAGGALIEEAESGTLDRVLSTRVSMTRLLVGKLVYLTAIAFAQLVVMFVWGQIFFGVELTAHLAGFVVISVATALAASTFGLVLAAISRSRMQLVAIANLLILVMSALGGSMVPRYMLSEKIQRLGLLTLNAWAIDGFLKVFWREEPLSSLWPQVAVLIGISALLFAAARRLARRWDVT